MEKQQGNAFVGLVIIIAFVAGVIGWVANIVKLFGMTDISGHMGEFIIRLIGVFTGIVGAIAGYF